MKYIHIVIRELECKMAHADVLIYNECRELEVCEPFSYELTLTEEEIADLIIPNTNLFKMSFEHIGGGGVKRKN